MDAEHMVQMLILDSRAEAGLLRDVLARAIRDATPLYLGRFLTDLGWEDSATRMSECPGIVLRQYGGSRFVNAPPPLADGLRAEIGLAEAEAALRSGDHQFVVLSQFLDTLPEGLLTVEDLVSLIESRPAQVRLILTGRSVPAAVAATPRLAHYLSVLASPTHGASVVWPRSTCTAKPRAGISPTR